MSIITLTTDLGLEDYYVSSLKGAIYSQCSDVIIVDVTHHIPKYDLFKAAFILKNAYKDFPPNTVHIIGVMPFANATISHVAVYCDGHYFVGADNGIFSLIFHKTPDKIVELTIIADSIQETFPTKDIFVKAACHIARGGTLEVIGKEKKALLERTTLKAEVQNDFIRAIVIYIDSYGNAITNLSKELFEKAAKGRRFTISFRNTGYDISTINKSYQEVPEGERLALFGTTGLLEIAMNIGNANKLLGIKLHDLLMIEFHDN